MPAEQQVAILFAGVNGYLDKLQSSEIERFQTMFLEHMESKHPHVMEEVRTKRQLSPEVIADMHAILKEFIPSSGLKMKS